MGRGVGAPHDDPKVSLRNLQGPLGLLGHAQVEYGVSLGHPWCQRGPITFGVGKEPLALGCPAEWTLETAPRPAIVLTFRGWDGQTSLLLQGQVTVRVGVCAWSGEGQEEHTAVAGGGEGRGGLEGGSGNVGQAWSRGQEQDWDVARRPRAGCVGASWSCDLGGACPSPGSCCSHLGTEERGTGERPSASLLSGPSPHLHQHLDGTWPRPGQWGQHEPGGHGQCGQPLSRVEPGRCPWKCRSPHQRGM